MKYKVRDINFRLETRRLMKLVQVILDSYDIPITVRQIFYRLVAEQIIDNTIQGYRKVSNVVRDGRYAGLLDWDKITDETRDFYKPHSYT